VTPREVLAAALRTALLAVGRGAPLPEVIGPPQDVVAAVAVEALINEHQNEHEEIPAA
jgi:hypothetical protein